SRIQVPRRVSIRSLPYVISLKPAGALQATDTGPWGSSCPGPLDAVGVVAQAASSIAASAALRCSLMASPPDRMEPLCARRVRDGGEATFPRLRGPRLLPCPGAHGNVHFGQLCLLQRRRRIGHQAL